MASSPALDTFKVLHEIRDDVAAIMLSGVARPWPLGFWRTVLAVWLGVTLAGITLAALTFLAVATFGGAAVDDVQGQSTYDVPTIAVPFEETP